MTVCYFGIYKSSYTRNSTLIRGLKENSVEVIECNTREASNKKYWQLIKKHQQIKNSYDVMVVGFPGQTIMPLAWVLAKLYRKKIIFDAFVSLYDSIILDRKQYSKKSIKSLKYWLLDWFSCKLADIVLLDADEHAKYFMKTFKIRPEKLKRILVSCDDSVMYPRENKNLYDYFLVHFHGTYIPIQGVEYIMEVANILKNENIKFNIVGRLKDYHLEIEKVKAWGLTGVNFIDFLPYRNLAEKINEADVCLGMFGKTEKAFRCGAFKITEAMACKKPVITGETPALREFLKDRESVLFCRMADAKDLAAKILELKNNSELRKKIADGAYRIYQNLLTPKAIAKELISIIKSI